MSTYPPNAPPSSAGNSGLIVVLAIVLGLAVLAVVGCGVAGFVLFRMAAREAQKAAQAARKEFAAIPIPALEPAPGPYVPEPVYIPQPEPGYRPTGDRVEWHFPSSPEGASGTIAKTGDNAWTETRSDGFSHLFIETESTAEYVQLYDASRNLDVRLYADRIEWKRGDQTWFRGQSGSWKPKP